MKRSLQVALGFTLLALSGCHPRLPIPFTADRLARVNSGYALMHYLRQSDAGLAVCDPQSQGPRVELRKPSDMKELAAGLHTVDAERWRECTRKLLTALPQPLSSQLMTELSGAYRKLLIDKQFEQDATVQARLSALHTLYLDRPRDVAVPAPRMQSRMDDLRNALTRQRLTPTAARYGRDLLMAVSLEAGTWNGAPVTLATLDEALAQKDEELLRRIGSRLPDTTLRGEAVRRLVRLRIARSPYDEVRATAQAVEDRVVQQGNNPLSLNEHKPLRAWLDGQKLPARQVLMRQKVWKQRVTLLGNAPGRAAPSVLPELDLRGILSIELEGVSRPVTLCAPPEEHLPDPCLPATLLEIQNPLVYRDTSGVFRFVEHVSAQDALRIVGNGARFPMPVTVPGALITGFDWGLRFEKPEPLIFHGAGAGGAGPNLGVGVDTRDEARLVFSVNSGQTYLAVVERDEVPSYSIGSIGARGFTGETGYRGQDGVPGEPGRPAHCPSRNGGPGGDGYPGGPGGDGGPGGPGGPGGSVDVRIGCGGRPCGDVVSLLQPVFFSRGGDGGFGGSGGSGGNGGPGGPGGPGTTCTKRERVKEVVNGKTKWREVTSSYSLSSGPSGSWGPSGPRGLDGPPGPPGPPGPINVTTE